MGCYPVNMAVPHPTELLVIQVVSPPPSRVLNCHILAGEFSKIQHPLNNACKIMITTVNECMSAGR